jgi:hypothetical protein
VTTNTASQAAEILETVAASVQAGAVQEFTARKLFVALHAHAESVARELRDLDEKDAGYRGDNHIRAILAILDSAL